MLRQRHTLSSVLSFLSVNFNVRPSEETHLIEFERYTLLISATRQWFGDALGDWLMDCFTPTGYTIDPGYEDSLSHYCFDFETVEDMKEDFEEFLALTTFPDEVAQEG